MPIHPEPTLAEVAEEFSEWRRTRTTARTPAQLQQKAVALLSSYRVGEVLKALNLSHKNVKRWKQRWLSEEAAAASKVPTRFLALPIASEPVREFPLAQSRTQLKLTRHSIDGSAWSVEGDLSPAQWQWAWHWLHESEE